MEDEPVCLHMNRKQNLPPAEALSFIFFKLLRYVIKSWLVQNWV